MPDREKVIKGLECCLGANDCDVEPKEDCPYKGMCLCAMALRLDVLALLKEQDAVKPEWSRGTPFCGHCGHRLEKKNRNTSGIKCPTCGRLVKWDA